LSPRAIDRLQQAGLAILEGVVLALFLTGQFVDLSFLDLWQAWLGMVFFWLIVLLLVASLRMFSKHRHLAMAGLGLVAMILLTVLFSISPFHHK
jgi:hypothetical protein